MIASLLFRASYRRFLAACRIPLDAQARCLRRVLRGAADSEIGRAHDFAAVARIRDAAAMIAAYRERVPVRPYRDMRADLEAVYAGDWRRLCPSRPVYFAMTAGSTGRFKYIPVTAELRRDLGRGSLAYYGALEAACPALRGLKAQFLVGSAEGGFSPGGVPQGFASGFNYKNLPRFLRAKFVLPYWIFTLVDAEDRAYAAGRILAEHAEVGALCAISPVNLINLRRALEENIDRLCADLRAGTLSVRSRSAVPGTFRCRPNPRRAQALEDAWRQGGTLAQEKLFPSLQALVCWQGGNMSYYLDELADEFGPRDLFEFPLSASEGLFAIPFRKNVPGGIAAVTSHFLEFLPDDDGASAALSADQLRVGACYRLVITTSGGLYRYDMEDIVRVTGFHERTPIIAFVSRANRQVSVANERLTDCDVTEAMAAATRRLGVRVPEFLFVPCSDRRYRVLVDGRVQTDLPVLVAELERQLRAAATGYDFEREDALLQPLELVLTRPGELRAHLDAGNGGGPSALPSAQIKPLHLTPEFNAHTRFAAIGTYAA
jgi:hypothetical protein